MKKSLSDAIDAAIEISKEYPNQVIRVMDKPNKTAIITASDWIYKERVLYGYHVVVSYLNGCEI